MPLINEQFGLAYFSIPKNASTSIKHVFYELETGKKFVRGQAACDHIHNFYRARAMEPDAYERCRDLWKFTVFRDPVKRIISAYSNRVIFHKVLETQKNARLRAGLLGLSLQPDLEEFCIRLPRYRKLSRAVRHHTRPYQEFVGSDLSRLDAVYAIENLGDLASDLSDRTGRKIEFPRLQTGGPKIGIDALTPAALLALNKFARPDYLLMNGMYQPFSEQDI